MTGSDPTIYGIYCGLALSVAYMVIQVLQKKQPSLNEIITILLSATGLILGINFGYIVLTVSSENLGKLQGQELPMILGALAVVWTSGDSLIKSMFGKSFAGLLFSKKRQRQGGTMKTSVIKK